MKRKHVAIIGAGASGVALAARLASRRRAPNVTLIERADKFGPGLAYSTADKAHLLNVRASRMSLLADRPDHFSRWLHDKRVAGDDPFAPRALYGRYVEDVLARMAWKRPFGLKRVRGDVVACRQEGEGWRLTLAVGEDILADAVVLAIGHQPARTPDIITRAGVAPIEAWDQAALARISPKDDVLIIGAGLSMVDAVLSLSAQSRTGVIYALSRRGLLPRPQLHPPRHGEGEPLPLPAKPSDALRFLRREAKAMAERGEPWQTLFDRLRQDTPAFWRRLRREARARFLRHARVWWDVHRHRAAPEVHARIKSLLGKGKLRVFAGELVSAAPLGAGFQVHYRQRGGWARHRLEVAHIINCTGADADLTRSSDALVRQLLAEGVARGHETGLGLDVDEEGRVLDAAGQPQDNLFALGPITQGAFWECTAVPDIRDRAAALAELLCMR